MLNSFGFTHVYSHIISYPCLASVLVSQNHCVRSISVLVGGVEHFLYFHNIWDNPFH